MSPWPPPLTVIDERSAWSQRARRYRREVANWCELCEKRTIKIWGQYFRPPLEVHHRQGRGIRSAVGYEDDVELMTLCESCHDRITSVHRRLGRQRGQVNSRGRIVDPFGYSHTIAEVTAAARPRYIARAFRRTLIDRPPNQAVIIPRR